MHPVVQDIINQLKPFQAEKIILFGSYATGKTRRDSDVDLLIIKQTSDAFLERHKKARMLLKTTTPVDIFVLTPEESERAKQNNLLVKEAVETGTIVYG
ncbi:MAG: nucleotidyltransferase domain-containing protein [Dehalococcoidia bacterium]|nr:nucleotidyltransferase domain-containing protein [Dehalococcoidia bacterium]